MRIAVCDDDKRICAVLKNEITSLVPDAKVDIYSNGNVLPSGSGSGWLSLDNICFIPGV